MNLKVKFALLASLGLLFGISLTHAQGVTTGHVSRSDHSTSTNWSEVVFPGAPLKSIRLLSLSLQGEAPTNETWMMSGSAAVPVWYGFKLGTNLVVSAATQGSVVTNQYAILSVSNGLINYVVFILNTNNGTNVVFGGPGPVLPALFANYITGITNTNAVLWVCTNRAREWTGTGRSTLDGPAIFAAQVRAPLAIRHGSGSGPVAGNSNQVRRATAYYEPTPNP